MLFAYTRLRLFHELFTFGLLLVFIGGIVFLVSAWPVKGRFPKENPRGSTFKGLNLEYFNLVILAICIMVSAIYGALSAIENFTGTIWGLGRDPIAFLAEAIIRKGITFGGPSRYRPRHDSWSPSHTACSISSYGYVGRLPNE